MSCGEGAVGAVALRSALWLLLGGWLGSWALFGLVVAPTAFRVLPSAELAGSLVGPVLTALHLYGGTAGVALACLSWALGRPAWLSGLPLGLAALCLYSHFGISAELASLRPLAFGEQGSLAVATRFGQLHRASVAIFVAVGCALVVLVVLHARSDSSPLRGDSTPS